MIKSYANASDLVPVWRDREESRSNVDENNNVGYLARC